MKPNVTCEYNMDTGCVEIRMPDDGVTLAIDCTTVENQMADNRFERSELGYLIYNNPLAYAELALSGAAERYLKNITDYSPIDS